MLAQQNRTTRVYRCYIRGQSLCGIVSGNTASSDRTAWLRREDSNLCISESEFAKTLRSGREHSNVRISIEVVVPHLIPKESLRP
jgi:hypothetical protein